MRYLGISNLATGGSQILARPIGGFALDIGNAQWPGMGYDEIFIIGGIYFALGVIVLPKIRETRGMKCKE